MWLDLYIEMVKNDIVNCLKKVGKMNVTAEEQKAFQSLLHNNDIVIRPADKGSGIVVLDKTSYLNSLQKEMEESDSYAESENDLTQTSMKEVKKLVNSMSRNGSIPKDMKQYLLPKYPKAGSLKGNPKLHKKSVPMRSIVNGMNTPTERLAELAEHELNEFVTSSPSYIRDTTDFINKLKDIQTPLPEGTLLFCFDVCKLYPSVPKKEGIDACRIGLNKRSNMLVPTEDVVKMIEVVLNNNNFNLGGKHYIQKKGIAIGSKLGKNFACSYMRIWDEKLMNFHQQPLFYKRFIDDGFGLWTGGEESLRNFARHANSIHKDIQVELRYSPAKIEFLDTWVILENGKVYTSLYKKPTDKQLYLHKSSNHPPNTKSGLAYGLGLRLKRICEKEQDYQKHRTELKQQLRRRGYSGKEVERQLTKVDTLDREDLLQKQTKKGKDKRVPLVLTYTKQLPNIHSIVRKHMNILYRSEKMMEVFQSPPIIAYRRDKNICDILVHGKTNKALKQSVNLCKCRICLSLHMGEVWSTDKNSSYNTASVPKCTDRNLIYALVCSRCDMTVYVGETERSLKERTEEHLRDVRQQADKPIMRHFGGHTAEDVKVAVLQKVFNEGRIYRQMVEEEWIKRLGTKTPQGCNVKLNI
ncbi:uncharacterized protein LOC128555550 [Mercenaria mercenaria]|uniref:uncharacterized protein LOC128555550 n=1 Tax=Mercenaria mercenaria TaxID=6596 RepID=UPI00234EC3E4|nr:uncharacterized protein LOC128555550 [Mercenaria mercenaria]